MAEGKYPLWVRVTVGSLVLKIKNLSIRIENETDPVKQNALLAQQNKLISYINGLGVGVGSSDTVLLKRLRSIK